jgi:hypothetical protein
MPNSAQVGYFNANDESMANAALTSLRKYSPGAQLVQIHLLALPGQIEVWLAKVARLRQ